jgi:hypothetical protein
VGGGTVEVLRVGAIHDYTTRVDDEVEAKSKTKSKSKAWKMLGSGNGCLCATPLGFEPSFLDRYPAFDESMADFLYTGDA